MKRYRTILLCASICGGFAFIGLASERPIKHSDLPEAVQKTAEEQSKGAVIKRYVKDNEDGHPEYEVEMMVDGHSKDVAIAPDGKLVEIEEQVKLESLPADARQGLQSKAAGGTITKVESITKKQKLVAYEAQVMSGSRHSEIQVGPDGKPLDHEE